MSMLLIQARELNGPYVVYGLSELSLTISSFSIIIQFKHIMLDSLGSVTGTFC